ncbi:MAG TPA: hypothetical protein VF899_11160 [Pyrinomonadaceae bacterium]
MKRHLFSIVTSSYLLVLPVVSAHGQPGFTPWAEATNLGATVNSAVTDQHPAISKKGLSLYFISNRAAAAAVRISTSHNGRTQKIRGDRQLTWDRMSTPPAPRTRQRFRVTAPSVLRQQSPGWMWGQ